MSSEASLTLYRCGVCECMFQSAPECYAHVITHEAKKAEENVAETREASIDANFGDQIGTRTVDADASSFQESGREVAPALEVLAAASGACQKSMPGVDPNGEDIPNMPVILSGEGGIQIHIQEQEDDGEDSLVAPGDKAGVDVETETHPTVSYASLEQIRSQGDSIVIGSPPGVVCSTNEELDIADILINIKQEQIDGEGMRKSVENIEAPAIIELKDKEKPKKKKKLKKIIMYKDKIPIVRRRRKGEDFVDAEELENFYCCKYCGKRYAVLKSLRHHEKIHDTESLLYCDVCQKGFVKPSELNSHRKTHMDVEEREKENNGKYKCRYCVKQYTIEKSLKHHEKVHEVGKRYLCNRCTKTFFKPSDLERHQRVHRPLARCYVCNKSFRNTDKLEHHVRAHPELMMSGHKNKVKLVSLKACRYCGKQCTTFSQLCNHIRTHTKAKPFPCDICGKSFNRISNMNLHRKLHTGMKPFPCDVCGAAFADYANRNRHVKKYHQNDLELGCEYVPRTSKVPVVEYLPPAPKIKLKREDLVAEVMNAYRDLDKAKEEQLKLDGSGSQKNLNVVKCKELTGIPQEVQNLIAGQPNVLSEPIDASESGIVSIPGTSGGKQTEQVYVVFEDNPSICYVVEYEGDNPSLKLIQDGTKDASDSVPSGSQDLSGMGILGAQTQDATGLNNMAQVEIEEVNDEEAEDCMIFSHHGEEYDEEEDQDTMRGRHLINPDYVVLKSRQERKQSAIHKRFPCETCGARFAHRGSLKFHTRRHTKEGVIYCSICNAEFYRKSRLRVHMREHTGEKPYKCSVCERAFKVSYDLTIHMREHTGRDTVPCDHCDKIFYTRRAYNAHMRDQSTIKPYSCNLCGKLFKRGDQRRRHMLTHFEGVELPFKCHMCDRSFGDSSNRKRHIIKVHGSEALDSMPRKRVSLANHVDV